MPKLNAQQQQAVQHIHTPLLVLAGAGSGKTRVITHKIAWLIEQGFDASSIFAVTFTNKAAKEMKQRITTLLNKNAARKVTICTFHTLGLKILRQNYRTLGFRRPPTIFDSTDCNTVIKDLLKNNDNLKESAAILTQISSWKNNLIDADRASQLVQNELQELAATCYRHYEKMMHAYNAVDFDDLILKPLVLFQQDKTILHYWQNKVAYLLVDEYQDTNEAQYQIVKQICRFRQAFTVVGDDDQSIYAWRGAQPENLNKLKAEFSKLEIIKLEQNYRSTATILNAANYLIANNPHLFEKRLWSQLGQGEKITVLPCINQEDEADRIASDILGNKLQHIAGYGDTAILYRSNHQSRILEKALRSHKIPYLISGGQSFFERTEIKDLTAYLRLLINPDDDTAFLRIINIPRREIGAKTLEKIAHYANQRQTSLLAASGELGLKQQLPERQYKKLQQFNQWFEEKQKAMEHHDPVFLVNEILDDLRYQDWINDLSANEKAAEKRWSNVLDLVEWIKRLHQKEEDNNLESIVSRMMIMDIINKNSEEKQQDAVQLMTIHSAKGLEYQVVYIIGMEEEVLPHANSTEPQQIEEERRLAYVAITRARKKLTLSYTKNKRSYTENLQVEPSRFLYELPQALLEWNRDAEKTKTPETAQKHLNSIRQLLQN